MEKRGAFFAVLIAAFFVVPLVHAGGMQIPQDLLDFYGHNISELTVSNSSIVLFDHDRMQIYYMYVNPTNETYNITTTMTCVSHRCPSKDKIIIDYLHSDNTTGHVKKAGGIYFLTNDTELGKYDYNLTVSDSSHGYEESKKISLEVLSPSLWRQFWHNIAGLFGLN